MNQPTHFLPDSVRDLAPPFAERLEQLRRSLLDAFVVHGYQYVNPPLLEYANALTSGAAADLKRNLITLGESGENQLALRADFTPQIARLDSITAQPQEVQRYCYAGSILLKQPRSFGGVRNPMQLGAELLGSSSEAADREIIDLMLDSLLPLVEQSGINSQITLRLSDNRIIARLCTLADFDNKMREDYIKLLQSRSLNQIQPWLSKFKLKPQLSQCLASIPNMFGDSNLFASNAWQQLAQLDSELESQLARLKQLCQSLHLAWPKLQPVIDLADMSGYAYHTALTFTLYLDDASVVQGGRYDGIGNYFGLSRSAIGFSLDMDMLLIQLGIGTQQPTWIWVDFEMLESAKSWIQESRNSGQRVVCALEKNQQFPNYCTHRITGVADNWQVKPISPQSSTSCGKKTANSYNNK